MNSLKSELKNIVGTVVDRTFPTIANDIDAGGRGVGLSQLKSAVIHARLHHAKSRGDEAQIEKNLHAFWNSNISDGYYERTSFRYRDWFLGDHYPLAMHLVDHCAAHPVYTQMLEIGCGDGQVLNHYAKALTRLERFTGIDINPSIIEQNTALYAHNPQMSFKSGNANVLLPELFSDGTILSTYGGVLEYFTRTEIEALLRQLRTHQNTGVALVEPLDVDHDLDAGQTASRIYGAENSFSHHYPDILEQAGFTIDFAREIPIGIHRFILIFARG
jgi:SAM-dependent methyltransferase